MDVGGLLGWLLVGLIAGWAAGEFTRGRGFGLVGNIVVGVLGAFLGGLMAGVIGIGSQNIIGSILLAFIGAVILLFIINLVTGRRTI
jgi:uncharacterized membrane protein YeaQ/YmgE (transglycosylase-associated protein family)